MEQHGQQRGTTATMTPPRTHHLKCWPIFFHDVKDGRKTFEIRKNDRGFQSGDVLVLHKFEPDAAVRGGGSYIHPDGTRCVYESSADKVVAVVTYVLSGFGLEPGYVCLAISVAGDDMG